MTINQQRIPDSHLIDHPEVLDSQSRADDERTARQISIVDAADERDRIAERRDRAADARDAAAAARAIAEARPRNLDDVDRELSAIDRAASGVDRDRAAGDRFALIELRQLIGPENRPATA